MTPVEARCLEAFPTWLKSLGDDAQKLASVVESDTQPLAARRGAATALNYLFKSLDLIPDGLEEIGFVDDAFVFRVAASTVSADDAAADASGTLGRLSGDAALVRDFLGDVYPRLTAYVSTLGDAKVRGRNVDDVLADATSLGDFVREARQWATGYQPPPFHRDDKNLVKLRSFLAAKLK
ncbi:MAG TPA: YkvA family protein [Polyangiaceae bacterium]|nr:YkvA family protein [Polyangiaceae bacterium]